jgi:hypothetical protein
MRSQSNPAGSNAPTPPHHGSLDGYGAGDHDQGYRFGRRPRVGTTQPFSARQYARLLILRSRVQAGLVVGDGAVAVGSW